VARIVEKRPRLTRQPSGYTVGMLAEMLELEFGPLEVCVMLVLGIAAAAYLVKLRRDL
jgi:hypothetical protein